MASAKLDVSVRSDGRTVEVLQRRPVRVLPTGAAGVVYGGDVFPLHSGDFIDLADRPYHKADCYKFVPPDGPIPYALDNGHATGDSLDIGRWNIEHNRFGNYLVFDANEDTAEAVAMLMEEVGLGVIRWDASSRPAEDGYHYDWFVRLEFQGSAQEAYARVESALVDVGPPKDRDVAGPTADTRREVDEYLYNAEDHERLMGIVEGLFASVDEWRDAHSQIAEKAAQLERDLAEALKAERSQLQKTVDEQRQRLKVEADFAAYQAIHESSRTENQNALAEAVEQAEARATARIKQAEEDRRAAEELGLEAEAIASEQRLRALELEIEMTAKAAELARTNEEKMFLETRLSELLAAEAERTQRKAAGEARKSSSGRTSADRFVQQVLPRLTLSPEAMDTLVAMKDPSKVFDVLYALHNKQHVGAVPLRGVTAGNFRIKEVDRHLHIGDEGKASDMGRVYYCLADERVFVHVHRKQNDNEQRQTVERFAAWCRDQID